MPSGVIQMLGLAVVTAITVGALTVYYALNGGEQLHVVNADPRRRNRRGDGALQPVIQERPNQVDVQPDRGNENRCRICFRNIQNTEYDLTILPCTHRFHCRCISDHLSSTAEGQALQSACPVCQAPYSIDDIE
ncbi:uncharacterized protein LOC135844084 [Planococcus citri]|uniref:uncharacterized protein LOC135844084 n=1 Tax=Planococcus citri TaxID=170843 RepID=UPI0031F890C8